MKQIFNSSNTIFILSHYLPLQVDSTQSIYDLAYFWQLCLIISQKDYILLFVDNVSAEISLSLSLIKRIVIFGGRRVSLKAIIIYKIYMSQFNRIKELFKRAIDKRKDFVEYWKKSPTTKIISLNVGVYCLWKLKFIPEEFLVKHFSAERFNVEQGRLHTLITHSFSHTGIFSLFFDMLMIGLMGKAIQIHYGAKYILWLYGLGALFGGASSSVFKMPSPFIQPDVGADSVVAAYLTFIAMQNPTQTFLFFVFPVRAWVLVFGLGFFSLVFDPQKKYFAGITAGITVHQMMRARFI